MTANIRIQRVPVKDLPSIAAFFIDGAAPGSYIPITKPRAEAQVNNPYADPDDIGLLLAWDGNQCVGYFGILPVRVAHAGKLHKVHWFTTWSAHPDATGKGIGSALMANALELVQDYAIVGSAPARHVSAKFGLQEVEPLDYARIDFRLAGDYNPLSLLLRLLRKLFSLVKIKLNIDRAHRALADWFEGWLGPLFRPRLRAWAMRPYRPLVEGISFQQVQQVRPPADERPHPEATGFYRDSHIVNWMLAHPWVQPAGGSESEGLDYGFTDTRPGFQQIAWQMADSSGANLGYVVFQISRIRRSRMLKVLDYELVGAAGDLVLPLALKLAEEARADLIEGPASLAALQASGRLGGWLVQRRQRICQVWAAGQESPMARARQQLRQRYVDGDTAFT